MWFRIKCAPTLIEGPRHVFAEMKIARDVMEYGHRVNSDSETMKVEQYDSKNP